MHAKLGNKLRIRFFVIRWSHLQGHGEDSRHIMQQTHNAERSFISLPYRSFTDCPSPIGAVPEFNSCKYTLHKFGVNTCTSACTRRAWLLWCFLRILRAGFDLFLMNEELRWIVLEGDCLMVHVNKSSNIE